MAAVEKFVGRRFETRRVQDMFVDHTYQRPADDARVARIVAAFDPDQLGVLLVNERARGKLSVICGQHRMLALRALGVVVAECEVLNVSVQREAELFWLTARGTKPLSRFDAHKAAVRSGDAEAVIIDGIVKGAGYILTNGSRKHGLSCPAAVYGTFRRYGAEVLTAALCMMGAAWPSEAEFVRTDNMVRAMSLMFALHPDLQSDRFLNQLSAVLPRQMVSRARTLGYATGEGVYLPLYRELVKVYNGSWRTSNRDYLETKA